MDTKETELLVLQYPNVPSHTVEALYHYWVNGWQPGSFLTSMLTGDLYSAAARADHWNKNAIGHIVDFIVNHGPQGSWGSSELVHDWCKKGHYFQQFEKKRLMNILSTELV